MHITDILISRGYKTYGYISYNKNFSSSAKEQIRHMMETRVDLVFIEGGRNSDCCRFLFPKPKDEISSMLPGGLAVYYVKDGDFNAAFMWGLSEAGKPPTLIFPRPKIKAKVVDVQKVCGIAVVSEKSGDDLMNHCLAKEDHFEILRRIESGEAFEYEIG